MSCIVWIIGFLYRNNLIMYIPSLHLFIIIIHLYTNFSWDYDNLLSLHNWSVLVDVRYNLMIYISIKCVFIELVCYEMWMWMFVIYSDIRCCSWSDCIWGWVLFTLYIFKKRTYLKLKWRCKLPSLQSQSPHRRHLDTNLAAAATFRRPS